MRFLNTLTSIHDMIGAFDFWLKTHTPHFLPQSHEQWPVDCAHRSEHTLPYICDIFTEPYKKKSHCTRSGDSVGIIPCISYLPSYH